MTIEDASPREGRVGSEDRYITGLAHISVHVRDVDEATAFWMDLFDAEPFRDRPGRQLFHVILSGVVLAFFEQPGVIDTTVAYPHYAFTATPEGMRVLSKRLEDAGVRTHPFWTRDRITALMYFRDPSGNLFELYCPKYDRPDELRMATDRNGDYEPPIGDLMYDWPQG
jgi:catechol 2,3-dioxygenase-like lactoylglutathione lyase family enzyme